ncbi:unnamed protein product [Nippostrongylus brasiliensis]|uniref:Tubulin tyrosine ligase n=1 Tax=Nippostrongylus brasiliensis TaxID=27835 RepID=A0A158R307_NIPBR|nr:unnamed protein product [Nippostrongylus brasiliensis]
MALEEGRNALKQIEDGASTGSGGGWTPRPYDSPLHGVDGDADTRRIDTPPHQEVAIPPAPTTECDPELVRIFYKHFERKAAGIDVNISVQERKDFQNPSSYEQLILNFDINEVAEDQRKYMDSISAAKSASAAGHSSASSKKKAPSSSPNRKIEQLFRTATRPKAFVYVDQLTNYLKNNFILHEPGRFLIIPKPYGVSCVGEPQKEGGVFENSVHNRKHNDENQVKKLYSQTVTISDCIPGLVRMFNEPQLSFCTGLKRYLSGAIVLPASTVDFENVKKSIQYGAGKPANCSPHYRALTSGLMLKTLQYIFVEKRAGKRARSGKFAVAVEFTADKCQFSYLFAAMYYIFCPFIGFHPNAEDTVGRHLPRLIFSHLLCPMLGDELYGRRLIMIDGRPATVQPKDLRRIRTPRYFPTALSDLFKVSAEELQRTMPLYCHVHSTIFPRFGWVVGRPRSEQDVADLYANTPPPQHFLAMVEALGMSDALMRYFQDDDGEEDVVGGDTKF